MIHGVVLAGGLSSRMGEDKRRLVLQGQTLLARAVTLLQDAGAGRVLISGADDLATLVLGQACVGVPDLFPHSGPPGGLYSVLAYLQGRATLDAAPLLLIPVDMPLLTAPTLRHLLSAAQAAQCCHYEGEVFPCVVRATPALHAHLRELFAAGAEPGGKRSMKAILKFAGAKTIAIAPAHAAEFRNVNTPEDWQAIR